MTAFPLCESSLCRFVASLLASSLSPQTIRSYLSALRYFQIALGLPDPSLTSMPRLAYIIRGVRRSQSLRRTRSRLPITLSMLQAVHRLWSQLGPTYDRTMLWAAFCLGFFGFMRAGEFTCPSLDAFSPLMLSAADIAIDSHSRTFFMTVRLRQSKTDQFGAGVTIHFDRANSVLCPVAAVLAYLAIRSQTPGPLFVFSDGAPLV